MWYFLISHISLICKKQTFPRGWKGQWSYSPNCHSHNRAQILAFSKTEWFTQEIGYHTVFHLDTKQPLVVHLLLQLGAPHVSPVIWIHVLISLYTCLSRSEAVFSSNHIAIGYRHLQATTGYTDIFLCICRVIYTSGKVAQMQVIVQTTKREGPRFLMHL